MAGPFRGSEHVRLSVRSPSPHSGCCLPGSPFRPQTVCMAVSSPGGGAHQGGQVLPQLCHALVIRFNRAQAASHAPSDTAPHSPSTLPHQNPCTLASH